MKILVYFSGDVNEPKGTPIRVKNTLFYLMKNGAEVIYASRVMPSNMTLSGTVVLGNPYARPLQLVKFVRQNNIDIVFIVTTAGLWIAPFLRLFTSAKIGCDLHSLRIEEEKIYKNLSPVTYRFYRFLDTLLCRSLHFAVGVSGPLGRYYKKVIPVYHLFPVGVDLSMFNPDIVPDRELLAWKGDSLLIGYAGNTKWYQGLDTVLEALAKLNKEKTGLFKLVIVASSLDPGVTEFIEKNNLSDSVFVLGKQPHDKIPSLLMSADILTIVRPSDMVTEYAFPSKLPEHLALGKPLIVSKVGDIDSYIVDGISGIVIRPGNSDDLYVALLRLTDTVLRKKLGRGAVDLAKNRFEITLLNKNFYDFLLKQLKG